MEASRWESIDALVMQQACQQRQAFVGAGFRILREWAAGRCRQFLPAAEKQQKKAGSPANRQSDSCSNAVMRRLLVMLVGCLVVALAHARQDPAPVSRAIDGWLKTQTQGLPGQVSYEIGSLDPDNQLAPCAAFDVSRPQGTRAWGRTNVLVRCLGEAGWRVFIPVHVRVKADYLISARPISQGQEVGEDDLATQIGDLSELPANILTDPALAIGKTAASAIPAGRPLRADMLRAPIVVRQGQTVKVLSRGPGFAVANEGRALNNAVDGQVAQVRLANGQVVSGIARQGGTVEVTY
jgi:flagella basal body P-ring formation protein FlgA